MADAANPCLLCNRYTCRCGEEPPAEDDGPDWTPWWTGFAANA